LRQVVKTLDLGQIRLSRQIEHPNVCRVYEIAEVDGQAPAWSNVVRAKNPLRS
jgi:hypothetical protein